MLFEVDWAEDGTYRPGEYNSPEKFFNDGLENSNEFDLQLGYFSSATISVLADGFATFISKGGKMRLVINHIVSTEDKNAISKGLKGGFINCFDLTDFAQLRKTFDEYTQQFFECLVKFQADLGKLLFKLSAHAGIQLLNNRKQGLLCLYQIFVLLLQEGMTL